MTPPQLYTGKPPFSEISHDAAVMLRVMAKERPPRPCDASGRAMMSDALWTLVQQCWSHDVAERPSMARVVQMMQEGNGELRLHVRIFQSCILRFLTLRSRPSFGGYQGFPLVHSHCCKLIGPREGERKG
jgi:hypothetical protein